MTPSKYKHFYVEEFACRCGKCGLGIDDMHEDTMYRIEWLRHKTGIVMPVTSAVRCLVHDNKHGGSRRHTLQPETGKAHAIDVQVSGTDAKELNRTAIKAGLFTGMGYNQRGPHSSRFMHYDTLWDTEDQIRELDWSY